MEYLYTELQERMMAVGLDTSPLAYQISPFVLDYKPRFIVQRKDTLVPSVALSVYEQYLNHKTNSHNTVKSVLKLLIYLFTWADRENLDLEGLLLRGELLSALQIRKFGHWLSCRGDLKSQELKPLSISGSNTILMHSSKILCWFARQYGLKNLGGSSTDKETLIDSQKKLFFDAKKKDRRIRCAPDLTEEEIFAIDQYLRPENRTDASPAVALRDFLFWRIAIEFGLREGEILALRLSDCPHRGQDFFNIVRIEERGLPYRDPRGAYAPRPKTLSRHLGFLFNSPIPNLLNEYSTQYRYKLIERAGKKSKQFVLDHNFLIVNHHRTPGEPLAVWGVQTLAEQISRHTGIPFHWHLTRHAFFNRAYASIVDIENKDERKARLMDLVYWGGWSDEKSLQIYINRARKSRGEKALMLWQAGGNEWAALGF